MYENYKLHFSGFFSFQSSVHVCCSQTVYDEWFITLYNTVYTSLPVLALSLFDQVTKKKKSKNIQKILLFPLNIFKLLFLSSGYLLFFLNALFLHPFLVQDVNDRWSFQYPQLYAPGQQNLYFSKKAFLNLTAFSCYSSLVLYFVPWAAIHDTVRDDGKDIADYQSFALFAQTCLLIVVSIQVSDRRCYNFDFLK